jgi:hypothetical protein
MELEIRPDPSAEERAAIAEALAQEAEEGVSAWALSALPELLDGEEP